MAMLIAALVILRAEVLTRIMMASVPDAEHYREIADKLREAAWSC